VSGLGAQFNKRAADCHKPWNLGITPDPATMSVNGAACASATTIWARVGSRVLSAVRQAADGTCTGAAVDLTAATTVHDRPERLHRERRGGYPNFSSRMGTQKFMEQMTAEYVASNSPIPPAIQGRIVCTTSGATACPLMTAPSARVR